MIGLHKFARSLLCLLCLSSMSIPTPAQHPDAASVLDAYPATIPHSLFEQGDEEKLLMERYYGQNKSSGTYLEIGALVRQSFRPASSDMDQSSSSHWPPAGWLPILKHLEPPIGPWLAWHPG